MNHGTVISDATSMSGAAVASTAIVGAGAAVCRNGRGCVDGHGDGGVWATDVRLVRRAVLVGARGSSDGVPPQIALDDHACVLRWTLDDVAAGDALMLLVEVDGADVFSLESHSSHGDLQIDGNDADVMTSLGEARPDARVRISVAAKDVELLERDGIALSELPVVVDGAARTGMWRWRVGGDADGRPVEPQVELSLSWTRTSEGATPPAMTFDACHARMRERAQSWLTHAPTLSGPGTVARVVERSLDDLGTLRRACDAGDVLAASVPWQLEVHARDAIFAAWALLPVAPDVAVATLRHLAQSQARAYDVTVDAEPGKILHDERSGIAARRWHARYYGAVDTTPLFLMLLAETQRWVGGCDLARELEEPARAALGWIRARVDEDDRGMLGFWRRAERGIDVQTWKESPDSQRDHAGREVHGLIRPVEAQAYGAAALHAGAWLAGTCWNDGMSQQEWTVLGRQLERQLREHFVVDLAASDPDALDGDTDPRRGGHIVLGLDSTGRPLDSLTSNIGHVLWAGVVHDALVRDRSIAQLTHPALASGCGLRTMSTLDAAYDPSTPHRGGVWALDTAIAVAGIARHNRMLAGTIGEALFELAASHDGRMPAWWSGEASPDGSMPSVLGGVDGPSARGAAAPLLMLRALLGLDIDVNAGALVSRASNTPQWLAGTQWSGVHARGERWNVVVEPSGAVAVTRA